MTSKGTTVKELCEEYGISYNTFYSRLQRAVKKGEPYPYPCERPYRQYIPLMIEKRKYNKKPKTIDLDKRWERICERMQDPVSREIAYLRLCQSFYDKDLSEDIQKLIRIHDTYNAEDPYITFQKENGLFHASGYEGV